MTFDGEHEAGRMRTRYGFGPRDIPGALEFATKMLGRNTVLSVPAAEVWGEGEATAEGLILVRNDLPTRRRDFVIFHECAELWAAAELLVFADLAAKESACDAIAAALLAPAEAFVEAVFEHGENFAALARDFAATQTAMALRFGEVTREAVKVERPGLTRTRGRPYAWELGARRVELTDSPARAAYLAA